MQNGFVERHNCTLQEEARDAKHLPPHVWTEALNTYCHIYNSVDVCFNSSTTHYRIWKWRMPNVKFMMYNYVDFDSLDDEGYVYVSIDVDNIFCAM